MRLKHMTQKKNFVLRKFDPADIDGIIGLLNQVFKPVFTMDWWKMKYELNPNGFFGKDGDIWVAESENKIVGHYAVIPEKIKFYEKVVDVAQSVDTATHPDYRGMGMFSALAKKVYSEAMNRYVFLFGFPSEMAHGGFLKLGWKDLSSVPEHTKILNYAAFTERKFKTPLYAQSGKLLLKAYSNLNHIPKILNTAKGANNEIQEVERFPDEIDTFWKRVRTNYPIIMERTSQFLNWKFSKQFGNYQVFLARSVKEKAIIGYIVLKKTSHTIDIIDLITLPNEEKAMLQLIDVAISNGKIGGADSIRCWFPKWDKSVSTLKSKGFISPRPLSLRNKYTPQLILYNFTPNGPVPNIKEWYYTYADTDYA